MRIFVVCTYTHMHLWFANACASLHEFQPDANIHVVWSTMKREFRSILSSNIKTCDCGIAKACDMEGNVWQSVVIIVFQLWKLFPECLKISWKFISWASKIAVLDLFRSCYLLSFMFHRCLVLFSKRQFLTTCPWNGNLVCFLKPYFMLYLFILEIKF